MLVLHNEEEETLIVSVELYQRQQNVKICVAQSACAGAHLCYLLVVDNACIVTFVVLEHHYGAVNPYGKLIEEVFLLGFHFPILVRADNIFGLVFAKYKFLAIHIFKQHLRQNEYAVL